MDQNDKLIQSLRHITRTIVALDEGRSSQKRVLIILNKTGCITQKVLTEKLGIQPGSASEVIGKLENLGMIRRTPSQTDRRTQEVCLTEKGRKEAEEAVLRRSRSHQKMFSCLTEQEKENFLLILEKLDADWEERYRKKHRR